MNELTRAIAATLDVQVLQREGTRQSLSRLCSMQEWHQAFAEMACILGGVIKRGLGASAFSPIAGDWIALEPHLPKDASPEAVWSLCSGKSDALDHVAAKVAAGWLPVGYHTVSGCQRATEGLRELGYFAEYCATSHPVLATKGAAYVSLAKRLETGLSDMGALGYTAGSESLIRHICDLVRQDAVFLAVTRE